MRDFQDGRRQHHRDEPRREEGSDGNGKGDMFIMAFQIADVMAQLAFAGRSRAKGHRRLLGDEDADIEH